MQPIYSQFDRPITINTPLGPDALLIVQFTGDEGLNRPYRYELDLACPLGTALAFADLLGQEVTVRLTVGAKQRYFSGVVRRLDETARDRVFTYYRAEVVPLLALLGLRVQSRIFEDRSVPEILKQVLDLPKLKVKYRLSGTYPIRPYTVQYNETDLDFAHRLMQQEGIAYYFEHDARRAYAGANRSARRDGRGAGDGGLRCGQRAAGDRRHALPLGQVAVVGGQPVHHPRHQLPTGWPESRSQSLGRRQRDCRQHRPPRPPRRCPSRWSSMVTPVRSGGGRRASARAGPSNRPTCKRCSSRTSGWYVCSPRRRPAKR
jgi:hypothetical protein